MKCFRYIQSGLNYFFHSFDSTKSQIAYISFVTSTDGYNGNGPCQMNTYSNYWRTKGYFRLTDPYNTWQLPEEPNNCSRADVAKAYCLGDGF